MKFDVCNHFRWLIICMSMVLLVSSPTEADQEASNIPHVQSSTYGRCYAKAIPEAYWGQAGTTGIYEVGVEVDSLLVTYPWFTKRLFLQCNLSRDGERGASVVRLGPWNRGHEAKVGDLALAFYFNDQLLARYSTLGIAGRPENVEASVSHYVVIKAVTGYKWRGIEEPDTYVFEITTIDDRVLTFDVKTGRLLDE